MKLEIFDTDVKKMNKEKNIKKEAIQEIKDEDNEKLEISKE